MVPLSPGTPNPLIRLDTPYLIGYHPIMVIGYARTSTIDQVAGFEAQLRELTEAKVEKIFQEQVSSVMEREQLQAALDYVREGDTFVVTKIDRLARSIGNLVEIQEKLAKKSVALRILNLGMDTTTPTGKLMLTVLGAVAQFERELMLERQREGIIKAQGAGKYKGRKPIDSGRRGKTIELALAGVGKAEIARRMGIGEATVYRILGGMKNGTTS
jgi:DNA invertase Pin-like site-specific DNA recombinase